jgi:AcrR family transcriptional regulator
MSTQDDILKAALRLFRKKGLAGMSLRRVAEMVGITPMAIYHYYADKDALIDGLVAHGFRVWEGYLEVAARAPEPLDRVRAALRAYREFALAERQFFELMMLAPRRGIPRAPDSLLVTPSPSFNTIVTSVHQAMRDGDLAAADVGQTMLTIWAAAHGVIALHFTGRFGGDDAVFAAAYDGVLDRLITALGPRR